MDELLKGVDAIVYINRLEDFERNTKFLERWSNATSLPIHRIEAVVPQSIGLNDIVQSNINRYTKRPYDIVGMSEQEQKEICCSMSHAKAWEFAKSCRFKRVLILEDDTIPLETIGGNLKAMGDLMPKNTLLTYLNYLAFTSDCGSKLTSDGYTIDCYVRNNGWAITEGGIFSTSAYIVNFETITELVYNDIISTLVSGVIVDNFFSTYIQPNFRCAIPRVKLVVCDPKLKSTIGDNYKGIVDAYENDVFKEGYVFGVANPVEYFGNKYTRVLNPTKYITIVMDNVYIDYRLADRVVDVEKLETILNKEIKHGVIKDLFDIKIFTTEYETANSNKGTKTYIHQSQKTIEIEDTLNDVETIIEWILGEIL